MLRLAPSLPKATTFTNTASFFFAPIRSTSPNANRLHPLQPGAMRGDRALGLKKQGNFFGVPLWWWSLRSAKRENRTQCAPKWEIARIGPKSLFNRRQNSKAIVKQKFPRRGESL